MFQFRPLTMAVVLCCVATYCHGQTDFFWSTSDLNQGAANSDVLTTLQPGENGSLFLYYTTNGPIDSSMSVGAFLDVLTSMPGVIEFNSAETFDFEIVENRMHIDNRWLDEQGGGGSAGVTGDQTANLIDEWHAFTVTGGVGIQEHLANSDTGYDAQVDAFLFGRLDFFAVGTGSVDVITLVGDGGFNPGGPDILVPTFGNATVVVAPIPEPSGTIVMLAMTKYFLLRRQPRWFSLQKTGNGGKNQHSNLEIKSSRLPGSRLQFHFVNVRKRTMFFCKSQDISDDFCLVNCVS